MVSRTLSTFRVADALYGIPIEDVQEVTRLQELTPVPLAPPAVSGLMNLRGQVVTVVDLRRRLGYPPRGVEQSATNVVVRGDGSAVSLLVDAVEGFEDVTDRPFTPRPETSAEARDGDAATGGTTDLPDDAGSGLVLGAYQLDSELLLALDLQRAIQMGHHQ